MTDSCETEKSDKPKTHTVTAKVPVTLTVYVPVEVEIPIGDGDEVIEDQDNPLEVTPDDPAVAAITEEISKKLSDPDHQVFETYGVLRLYGLRQKRHHPECDVFVNYFSGAAEEREITTKDVIETA